VYDQKSPHFGGFPQSAKRLKLAGMMGVNFLSTTVRFVFCTFVVAALVLFLRELISAGIAGSLLRLGADAIAAFFTPQRSNEIMYMLVLAPIPLGWLALKQRA
jgi:hypothetical protein